MAREGVSHSFLTDWTDGTGLWRLSRTASRTLTCDSGLRSAGRTGSIDLRIRRSLEGNAQLSSWAYHCPSAGHSSPCLRGQPWASVPRPRSTLVLGRGLPHGTALAAVRAETSEEGASHRQQSGPSRAYRNAGRHAQAG